MRRWPAMPIVVVLGLPPVKAHLAGLVGLLVLAQAHVFPGVVP